MLRMTTSTCLCKMLRRVFRWIVLFLSPFFRSQLKPYNAKDPQAARLRQRLFSQRQRDDHCSSRSSTTTALHSYLLSRINQT